MIFSGTLNFFLLMMRSSYSMIGLIGSSGTTMMFPLFAVRSEETSTSSSFSRTVRLLFYPISPLKYGARSVTYHDLFGVIWTHPFPLCIGHDCQWGIQAIEVPRQGAIIA